MMLKWVLKGYIVFGTVQPGSRRFKNVQEGPRRLKKVHTSSERDISEENKVAL